MRTRALVLALGFCLASFASTATGEVDRWLPLSVPSFIFSPHSQARAVWTGEEMIVWGGTAFLFDGVRYAPATETWQWMNPYNTDTPCPRYLHTAIWTGIKMLVYGGIGPFDPTNCSHTAGGFSIQHMGLYEPATDSWINYGYDGYTRFNHSAVRTNAEMIVWGGESPWGVPSSLSNGFRKDMTTLTNIPLPQAPLGARSLHTAVWTGTAMIVWGGAGDDAGFDDGARYNWATDTWTPMAQLNAPPPRFGHTAVWTGTEMIVWGGSSLGLFQFFGDGARYNPATDTWTPLPSANAPAGRYMHTAVWTGQEMIIFGGKGSAAQVFGDGARYVPATDTWEPLPVTDAPSPRYGHTAVWTDSEMIIWGGTDPSNAILTDGARYRIFRILSDLRIDAISDPPPVIVAGGGFDVAETTLNSGPGQSGPTTTRYYLSRNGRAHKNNVLLSGSRSVRALEPGEQSSGTLTVWTPFATHQGPYYVVACSDDLGVEVESDESNNCRASSTRITVRH